MEAIFLDCGAGGPQLKRNPLDGGACALSSCAAGLDISGAVPSVHNVVRLEDTMMRVRCVIATPLLVFAALSCSSSLEPRSGITLLVTNGSCTPGPCSSQEVLAFPSNQPNTPGGYWSVDLGTMSGPELCITLPPSATFRVIGVNADGSADTTKVIWTTAMPVTLGAQAPSASRIFASPSTSGFVPATATGWSITLPGGSQVVPGQGCGR